MTETLPNIVKKAPFSVEVEAGKKYFWCSCGHSKSQPFCDGAHKQFKNPDGTSIMKSVVYDALESTKVRFCGCKHSKTGAICDGSHNSL